MKIGISGCGLVAGVLMCLLPGLSVVAEVVDCVETRPATRFKMDMGTKNECWWEKTHKERLANVCRRGGEVDVALLGDSIMHYWEYKPWALETWAEFTNAYKVLNFGCAGDRTQHLLWRVRHGELDGYRAKCVVLMIGTNNNSDPTTSPTNVAAGVKAILDEIALRQPQAKVLLLPIFPRGFGEDDARHAAARHRNDETNLLIRRFADGKRVQWVDFTDRFVDAKTGWTTREFFPDRIHPGALGCRIWLEAMKPYLDACCGRPDAMELNVLNSHTLEAPDCEFGIVNYTPSWNGIELKDHFRQTGGWTRMDDGRVKGDIRLECTNACELVVLSFTANFRMTPVVGREWMADDTVRVLPVKQSKNIFLGAGRARTFIFPLADGKMLRAEFEQPVEYRAQDSRQWGPRWGLRMGGCQERRTISPGETFEFKVVLSVADGMRLTVPTACPIR